MESQFYADDTILAAELDLKAAWSFSEALCGPHSVHIPTPDRFRFRYSGQVLKGMSTTVGYIEHGTDITVDVGAREILKTYSISIPVSGEQELRGPQGSLLSNIDCGVAVSPEQPLQMDITGNCKKILVTISRESLERVLEEILGQHTEALLVFEPCIKGNEGSAGAWWRMVKHYISEVECARELYGCGTFSRDIEMALLKGLLIAQPSNYSDQIGRALGARIPGYVARAKIFIETNFRETIHLEDIEAVAGVSRLKLFESFRKYFGFTPIAYLKHFRLRQARTELLSDLSRQNVSSIALGVGFNHFGRFSADYKREFSETPSETISRKIRR